MEKKKSTNVLLFIMGLLIVFEIITRIIIIQMDTIVGVAQLLSLVFTALYGFWLYKKPHGNMLKFAMLFFAFLNIITSSIYLLEYEEQTYHIAKLLVAKLLALSASCYCAGRLNRIDQNKYIMPIICIVFLGVSVIAAHERSLNNTATIWNILRTFNFTINYITLVIAYFVRYKEHKEAGLADAPKAK